MGAIIAAAAAVVGAGVSAYGQNRAAKMGQQSADAQLAWAQEQAARREQLLAGLIGEGLFEFTPVDAVAEATKALNYTQSVIPRMNQMAGSINKASAKSFEDVMRIAMGPDAEGGRAFDTMRADTNEAIIDQLNGLISPGAATMAGRGAVESGAASLGRGSVRQLYAGFLGITAEQQVQQGIGNYQNLVNLYRSGIPMVTGADLLPYGGLSTAEAIQTAQFNSTGQMSANMGLASATLGGFDTGTQLVGGGMAAQGQAANVAAQATAQNYQQIGSTIGSLAGMYYGYRQQSTLSTTYQGQPVYNSLQTGGTPTASSYYYRNNGQMTQVRPATAVA